MEVQLQGDSLESLLAQVSEELGPGARITSADRVRKGGVGGFFAKERFEVTVDVLESSEEEERPVERVPLSFDQLVEQADERDNGPFVPMDGIVSVPQPRLSTQSAGFQAVLSKLNADVAAAQPVLPAPVAPTGAGEVLVLVGDGVRALGAAQDHARRMRLDEAAVHLCAPGGLGIGMLPSRIVRSVEEARRRQATWQAKPHPLVVALDAPMTDPDWAVGLLDPLRPTAVWAVVSATTKTADLKRWLARIPGVTALAVIDADASADPRSVLELGLPVATVDGRPCDWDRS